MNFSIAKNPNKPHNTKREICQDIPPDISMASGSKWMNAPPNNAPAEKLTKYNITFINLSIFKESVNRPTKETILIIKVEQSAQHGQD